MLRVLVIVGSAISVAAGAGAVAAGAPDSLAGRSCPPAKGSVGGLAIAGAVTDVLHTRVYVDRRYVGAPPVAIGPGSRVCTDERGEAILDLSANIGTCIILPNSILQVLSPSSRLTMNLEAGTAWCLIRRANWSFGTPRGQARSGKVSAPTETLVGVVVGDRATTIKLSSGSATVSARRSGGRPLRSGRQLEIDARGTVAKVLPLRLTSEERIALARLRLARRSNAAK